MNWQHLFSQTGNKMSLQEVRHILEKNGFKKTFKIFNVVGTNGKGSISAFIAQGLMSKGKKVGLFTSPHLIRANERIMIDNVEITDDEFEKIYLKIKDENLNFFAATYVVAMLFFASQNCDFVVLEAGIGGSLDTTNAIDGDYGCITNVSLDHTEILGETEEKILKDKIGIYNEGMKFFYPSNFDENLKQIITETIPSAIMIDNDGLTYKKRNIEFASGILIHLGIDFKDFIFPNGRTQFFAINGCDVIIDVAHNYDGIRKSLEEIKANNKSFDQVVLTMKRTKDSDGVVKLLDCKTIFVYQKDEHFYSAKELGGEEIQNPREFMKTIEKNTLFIGSFHLAGEVLNEINK